MYRKKWMTACLTGALVVSVICLVFRLHLQLKHRRIRRVDRSYTE